MLQTEEFDLSFFIGVAKGLFDIVPQKLISKNIPFLCP